MMADPFGQSFSSLDFSGHDPIAVAVSGGSDSTGLLVLLHEHLSDSSRLAAITVDHGLRAASPDEARRVGVFCAKLGIHHIIKSWEGAKPQTGIQAAAREARYRLLTEAALEVGARMVLTGHTEDDLLETVAMRAQRGEGPGLAGMAPATLSFAAGGEMVWFARPLLGVSRALIRAELNRRGLAWIDDPSNANPDFERVSVRKALAEAGPAKGDELRDLQRTWSRRRLDMDVRAARLIDRHVTGAAPGLLLIAESLGQEHDVDAAAEVLKICAAHAGGTAHLMPDMTARELLAKLSAAGSFRFAVSGALLDRRKQGLFLLKEARAGRRGEANLEKRAARGAPLAGAAPQSLLRRAATAQAESPHGRPILFPWPLRLPLFDLQSASALARIVDYPAFLPSPCSP